MAVEKPPDRAGPGANATRAQLGPDLLNRKIGPIRHKPQQYIRMRVQRRALVSAHPLDRHAPRPAPAPNPFHRPQGTHTKQAARPPCRQPAFNRANHTNPEIMRIRSRNSRWSPSPVSILNHITEPKGPFKLSGHRSSHPGGSDDPALSVRRERLPRHAGAVLLTFL